MYVHFGSFKENIKYKTGLASVLYTKLKGLQVIFTSPINAEISGIEPNTLFHPKSDFKDTPPSERFRGNASTCS